MAKAFHKMVHFGEFVYVIGGRGENEIHNSVFKYHLPNKQWTSIVSLNYPRFGHWAVVYQRYELISLK